MGKIKWAFITVYEIKLVDEIQVFFLILFKLFFFYCQFLQNYLLSLTRFFYVNVFILSKINKI